MICFLKNLFLLCELLVSNPDLFEQLSNFFVFGFSLRKKFFILLSGTELTLSGINQISLIVGLIVLRL